ncbi:alpha-galactosidase [Streptococcus dysgalactiae subsp. equisimilis]|uniref:Alpha-galactosidase n=1 Tax=Streptococcus dysgalactiae subsp. equisimilis TaxID=119602 RepID=A0A9X8T3F6_STREQ|nr:alpha-galactosidase [Streptococcus dysgalactiae]SUN63294.1 alpha-galactosidase [Streptococcus dysgalactiae subsp. equisimilis]
MIDYQKEKQLFHLKTREFSYVIQVLENDLLVHRYFGKKINHFSDDNKITYQDRAFSPNPTSKDRTFSLDTLQLEFSSNGLGDFRTSAIEIRSQFGTALDLKYRSHKIYKGKAKLTGLPASFGSDSEVESLDIELYDSLTDVSVILSYNVFEERNILTRSAKVVAGKTLLHLEKLLSFTLDFPHKDFDVHTLTGRYGYEKEWTRTPLTQGKYSIGSIRGASSHSRTPFIALSSPNTTEHSGEIYSAHLIYSGNFTAFAETTALHTSRLGMGLNDEKFRWVLEPGQEFQSPEAILSYTDKGFTGMTSDSHEFIRYHLTRGKFAHKERPILINNWEGTYFDFTEDKLISLASEAAKVGIELFVLDDGWFGKRNSDTCSLGDWVENKEKLPNGLKGLAEKVNDLGMTFGLWFEPEMVSEDSDLFREHPEWAIQITGRDHTYSREQLVLDLSQKEVCDYIVESVSSVLNSANIGYVKWDMNRNITNIPENQANHEKHEFYHRYILGLYRILETLNHRFPNVLFESCSGGGGRNDLGMLYYMPQAWASDNTDAISRLSIQEGTSLIYPTISMGSHVSAVPNHQVGRITPLETRGNVAMLGNLGYELDLTKLELAELEEITEQVKTYKSIRETVQFGDYYRLQKTNNTYAYNLVSKDKSQVVFTFVKILSQPEAPFIRVRLEGLDPEATYHCEKLSASFGGDELMNIGLTIPYVQKDYFSLQYILNKQ